MHGFYQYLILFLKIFLAYAAKRTLPIIGKICEKGAGLDAVIRIAGFFVINVTANGANKFCHICTPFSAPSEGAVIWFFIASLFL